MRRNEYTITVKNGYFGNTAISAVRLMCSDNSPFICA